MKAAARAGTGKADSAAQAEATQSKPKRARGKQPKAEVEGNPSKKTKASEPSAASKGVAPPVAELANPDALGKEPAQDTKARDMKETDTRGPGEENGERKKRAPRARPTTEQIETAWKLKEYMWLLSEKLTVPIQNMKFHFFSNTLLIVYLNWLL